MRVEQGGEEDAIEDFARARGWTRGREYEMGRERVWFAWNAWKVQEDEIRGGETRRGSEEKMTDDGSGEEKERLVPALNRTETKGDYSPASATVALPYGHGPGVGHGMGGYQDNPDFNNSAIWSDVGGAGGKFEPDSRSPYEKVRSEEAINHYDPSSKGLGDKNLAPVEFNVKDKKKHKATEVIATTRSRRWWIRITWALTWWIPSFLLSSIGRMKRPDVRMAWREKVAIFMMVFLACGVVLFYIIGFGKILCPDGDKAWNPTDLAQHQGRADYYAAIQGKVYDVSRQQRWG
jgi:chitin synthase